MCSQADQEFNQNEIKKLNSKHNVEHCNSKLNEDHAVAAEQKIRELKKPVKKFQTTKQNREKDLKTKRCIKKGCSKHETASE